MEKSFKVSIKVASGEVKNLIITANTLEEAKISMAELAPSSVQVLEIKEDQTIDPPKKSHAPRFGLDLDCD